MSGPGTADGPRLRRLGVGQLLGLTIGVLLAVAVAGIGLALTANARLTSQRRLVLDRLAPAQRAALGLENALLNEETGVRGYTITGEPRFLDPYYSGLVAEARSYRDLRRLAPAGAASLTAQIDAVAARAAAWRAAAVAPPAHGRPVRMPQPAVAVAGKAHFDAVRAALARLDADLAGRLGAASNKLFAAGRELTLTLLIAGGLILLSLLGAGLLLRRIVTAPLERLGLQARRIAAGELGTPLMVTGGAREIFDVGVDVDAMRARISRELAVVEAARTRLEHQATELSRSNAELEQFAYVASHDLQEPLRKVASFCQALERRYHGQLDDRADQYIAFAVDGAKRMQILINDLLALSRVGRSDREHELIGAAELVAAARASLSEVLAEAEATVFVGELPVIRGDRSLLVSVFQNLIGNAVKFRGHEPPVVRISAEPRGDLWEFACADNGIGIDPDYAERIFVIFQRLHAKEAYPGTGIGLAISRKIIEYHGGRIWLDPDQERGACIRFTLPTAKETTP